MNGVPAVYSNPLPRMLILTAIAAGIATTALALALTAPSGHACGTRVGGDIAFNVGPPDPSAHARVTRPRP